jgi:hypothetical protein
MMRKILLGLMIWSLLVPVAAVASKLGPPEPVSPGSRQEVETVSGTCPTFSWGIVPGASMYRIVVYAVSAEGELGGVVIQREFSAGVSSWTPALQNALTAGGSYAWTAGAVSPRGGTLWSEPVLFRVAPGPSQNEFEDALEVVRSYLNAQPAPMVGVGTAVGAEAEQLMMPGMVAGNSAEAAAVSTGPVTLGDGIEFGWDDRVYFKRTISGTGVLGRVVDGYIPIAYLWWGDVGGVHIPLLEVGSRVLLPTSGELASGENLIPEVYEISAVPQYPCDSSNHGAIRVMQPGAATDIVGPQDSLCFCGLARGHYAWWCFNP